MNFQGGVIAAIGTFAAVFSVGVIVWIVTASPP